MAGPEFVDDHHLRVGTTDFWCAFPFGGAPDGFLEVMKGRELVGRYVELLRELSPAVIVELGIRRGGSTALLDELAHPDRLLAFEISDRPMPPLQSYIERKGLVERVRPHYGVDQAGPELAVILDRELGDRPVDLVVDDASHRYAETVASFDVLFPRLRPGGRFVIEDWNGRHLVADDMARALRDAPPAEQAEIERKLAAAIDEQRADAGAREIPLTRLAIELVLVRASSGDTVRTVDVNRHWIVVERGEDPLGPDFHLADLVHDHYALTAPGDASGV